MLGLALIGVFVAYLILCVVAIKLARRWARKHNWSQARWGWGAALAMYLLVFWDWIPTVAVHRYYCATESGFWVYKTLDQWKLENPGVAETLVANKKAVSIQNAYVLNQRFNWTIYEEPFFPLNYMIRREEQVVDSKTGDVLARYVDYSTSQIHRTAGWSGWKLWLDSPHCIGGRANQDNLRNFKNKLRGVEK